MDVLKKGLNNIVKNSSLPSKLKIVGPSKNCKNLGQKSKNCLKQNVHRILFLYIILCIWSFIKIGPIIKNKKIPKISETVPSRK